jgi:hypothetical protein
MACNSDSNAVTENLKYFSLPNIFSYVKKKRIRRETPTEERTRPFPASAGSVAGIDAPSRTKYLAAELRFANVVPLSGY